ncbi:alpha/beta hydrolase [Devosia sp. 63-57]|uniref:alpha/beta hydrolase n=1 Tax=Devosia sp. 63-57 TaxID=1895751 RepID=UPI00086C35B8|nr:alpha/beta hydrolase [Devosia sp. 63-57]ODT47869.1 MAG: hypothetical protein ABS74_16775 [Pelagibacterium sp. SCN 63-126]ODU86685.1 MAG: hypothetical protein ABT14_07835 [Pelagibacterium sp. SCN 63-17]OJX42420.1 MAG: hypothetical protein BGO80_13070 [Devosia sp. 63-57]
MDDPFRTRDHVADFDRYVALYAERSTASRARLRSQLDLAYGPGADEKLDLFFPDAPSGAVHLFIHGGYWRMFAKSDFSFIADTVTAAGAIAAVMDYSLMPAVRMETLVGQVERAALWLSSNAREFGGDRLRLSVSGHSAGAHLGALLLARQPGLFSDSLLLSGIYDLAPLQTSFLQSQIGLTDTEVQHFSPLTHPPAPSGTIRILVGEHETAPFREQAARLAQRVGSGVTSIAGGNHMSVALDLGDPASDTGKALFGICAKTPALGPTQRAAQQQQQQ